MASATASYGSTRGAGQRTDESEGRVFPCEQCGADLTFNIGQQTLTCPYCGFSKQLSAEPQKHVSEQDLQQALQRIAAGRAAKGAPKPGREIHCRGCGAVVPFDGSLTSTVCPYCASPIERSDVHEAPDRLPVDGVLPFAVTRETAWDGLRRWVKSRWFAPNAFRRHGVEGRFNGVYLPFWTYDAMTRTAFQGERGEHYWVTVGSGNNQRQEMRTRWYPASGVFDRFFDDVLVCAARSVQPPLVHRLEPWPLQQATPFNPELLAGYSAMTYDVPLDAGFATAKQRITTALETDVRQRIGGDSQRVLSVNTDFGALTYKHLLLPVWLLAYRFRNQPYQVVVNATTGEVQGQRPYSWVKITFAVLAGVALAAVIALASSH